MTTTRDNRPTFLLRLRPLPRVDPIKALRKALKLLLRQCSLQCLAVTEIETKQTGDHHDTDIKTSSRRTEAAKPNAIAQQR